MPAPQTLPQAPQLDASVFRSTQVPAQAVRPPGQAQAPSMHVAPPMQATPQAPQFATSRLGSTHSPAQASRSVGQIATHAPALQACPFAQATPQAPQFFESLAIWTHAPPHSSPLTQLHLPAPHVMSPVHTAPHVPQLRASFVVSTQAAPQVVSPCWHVVMHLP